MTSILFLNFRTKHIEPHSNYAVGLLLQLCTMIKKHKKDSYMDRTKRFEGKVFVWQPLRIAMPY